MKSESDLQHRRQHHTELEQDVPSEQKAKVLGVGC